MKYTHMLLFSLAVSVVWGIITFILGFIARFNQTMLLNNWIKDLPNTINPLACIPPNTVTDICPYNTEFKDVSLGDWANSFGNMVIVTGVVLLSYSICGAIGVLKKYQPLLIAMSVLIIIAVGLEYVILSTVMDGKSSFHENGRDEMVERIKSEFDIEATNFFTKMMNALMLTSDCCGIKGPEDFKTINHTVRITAEKEVFVVIPPACCKTEGLGDSNAVQAFENLLVCARMGFTNKANDDGCWNKIHEEIYGEWGRTLVGFSMFLILWEGIQAIILVMLLIRPAPKSPRRSRASTASRSSRQSQVIRKSQEKPKQKKFIPFSKVSSFVHSDVNRIKSTEIW